MSRILLTWLCTSLASLYRFYIRVVRRAHWSDKKRSTGDIDKATYNTTGIETFLSREDLAEYSVFVFQNQFNFLFNNTAIVSSQIKYTILGMWMISGFFSPFGIFAYHCTFSDDLNSPILFRVCVSLAHMKYRRKDHAIFTIWKRYFSLVVGLKCRIHSLIKSYIDLDIFLEARWSQKWILVFYDIAV